MYLVFCHFALVFILEMNVGSRPFVIVTMVVSLSRYVLGLWYSQHDTHDCGISNRVVFKEHCF
jgi:hypothetical protein